MTALDMGFVIYILKNALANIHFLVLIVEQLYAQIIVRVMDFVMILSEYVYVIGIILVLLVTLQIFLAQVIAILKIVLDFVIKLLENVFVIKLGVEMLVMLEFAPTIVQTVPKVNAIFIAETASVTPDLKVTIALCIRVLPTVPKLQIPLEFATLLLEHVFVVKDGKENLVVLFDVLLIVIIMELVREKENVYVARYGKENIALLKNQTGQK
jgi:hypothetical protein